MEMFMSSVRWLMYDWHFHERYMNGIRFGLLAPWQFFDIQHNPTNPEFIQVTSFTGVKKLVEGGLV
jgi:hypothetical protein